MKFSLSVTYSVSSVKWNVNLCFLKPFLDDRGVKSVIHKGCKKNYRKKFPIFLEFKVREDDRYN